METMQDTPPLATAADMKPSAIVSATEWLGEIAAPDAWSRA